MIEASVPRGLSHALAVIIVAGLGVASADAQQYREPSRYGESYGEPAYNGKRRALDGTPRRHQPAPAYHAPPRPSIWQGVYVGAHGGYSVGWATPSGGYDTVDLSGGALGGHIGYNSQAGDWVLGLEADGTWNDTSGSRGFAGPTWVDAKADWTSSFRARVGYAFGNVLLYATGGVAFGGFDIGVATPGLSSRVSETAFGYVAGGGIEMKLSDNWSGRLEALHYGFGDQTSNFATGSVPVDLGVTTVRAGLTFHFR